MRTSPDARRVRDALTPLRAQVESGGVQRLSSPECRPEPVLCDLNVSRRPEDDLIDELGRPYPCGRRQRSIEERTRFEAVQATRSALEAESSEPRLLESFRRAVADLSGSAASCSCDAGPDSVVKAETAVLAHLYELTAFEAEPIGVYHDGAELDCLRVPTLHDPLPVANVSGSPASRPDVVVRGGYVRDPCLRPTRFWARYRDRRRRRDRRVPARQWAGYRATVVDVIYSCGPSCGSMHEYLPVHVAPEWRVIDEWLEMEV